MYHWKDDFHQLDENERVRFASHLVHRGFPIELICAISKASEKDVGVAEVLKNCKKPPPQCSEVEKRWFFAFVVRWAFECELTTLPMVVWNYLGLEHAFAEASGVVLDHEDFGLLDLSAFPLSSQRFLREHIVPPFVISAEILPLLWREHTRIMMKHKIVPTCVDDLVRDFKYTATHYPVEGVYGGKNASELQSLLITTISKAIGGRSRFQRDKRPVSLEATSFYRFYGLGYRPALLADLADVHRLTEEKMAKLLGGMRRRVQEVVWQKPGLFFRTIPMLRSQFTAEWVERLPLSPSGVDCVPVAQFGKSWLVSYDSLFYPLRNTSLPETFVHLLTDCEIQTVGDLAVMSEVELWYAWEASAIGQDFWQVMKVLESFSLKTGVQIPHWLSLRYSRHQPA